MDGPQRQFSIPVSIVPLSQQLADKQHQQQSVIQSSQHQSLHSSSHLQQQLQSMHDGDPNDDEHRKHRDILTRRPSFRKILSDLASDNPVKMETYGDDCGGSSRSSSPQDEESEVSVHQPTNNTALHLNGSIHQGSPAAVVQLAPSGPSPDGTQYIITTQGPGNKIQAYTIKGQLPAINSPGSISPPIMAEEATRKREIRLYKNREAARECRRKKKEYVKCLENRVAVLENQNKALIEELKSLKDLYCSKGD